MYRLQFLSCLQIRQITKGTCHGCQKQHECGSRVTHPRPQNRGKGHYVCHECGAYIRPELGEGIKIESRTTFNKRGNAERFTVKYHSNPFICMQIIATGTRKEPAVKPN